VVRFSDTLSELICMYLDIKKAPYVGRTPKEWQDCRYAKDIRENPEGVLCRHKTMTSLRDLVGRSRYSIIFSSLRDYLCVSRVKK
jgi:hypothetical protein